MPSQAGHGEATFLHITTVLYTCVLTPLPGQGAHLHAHRQFYKGFCWHPRAVRGSGGPCLPAWGSCSRRARSHHLRHCALAAPAAALALGSGRSLLAPNGELSFHVNPEKAICGVDFIWKHLPCLSP